MEQNKKLFSTILMSVGAIFIIVAGGIFVSTTWQYIPEELKKLCLAVVTGGLFGGSYIAREKYGLSKTALAFYYLGICFAGFTTYSLTGMFDLYIGIRLAFTFAVMSVPVVLHFFDHYSLADSIFEVLLLDGIIFCLTDAVDARESSVLLLSASLMAMLMSAFLCYCRRNLPGEAAIQTVAILAYGMHAFLCIPLSIIALLFEEGFFFTVMPALFLVASITFLYREIPGPAMRILQSISLCYLSLCVCGYTYTVLWGIKLVNCDELIFFGTFVCNLLWMIVLNRKELVYINGGFVTFYAFLQLFYYTLSPGSDYYMPYTVTMAIALVLWHRLRRNDWEDKMVYRFAFVWLYMGLNAFLAMEFQTYSSDYSYAFWFALLFLQAAILCRDYVNLQAVWRTCALAVCTFALLANPVHDMIFYNADRSIVLANFTVEYSCTIIALSIVLLPVIWYHKKEVFRLPRFLVCCAILGILLLRNMELESLPNVLFLGIVALIILIISTIMNRKNYAIASATTLILIVLYLSRAVWMNIAWWVYLFVAGVGLVVYAIKREKAE